MTSVKISQSLINQICTCIRQGRPTKACVESAGISNTSHLKWMKDGSKEDGPPEMVMYYQQVTATKAAAEIDLIDVLHTHKDGSWQAAERLLNIVNDHQDYIPDVKFKVQGTIEHEVVHRVELPAADVKILLDSLREFVPVPEIDGVKYENVIDADVIEPELVVIEP